jgi:hypothetical protein
MPNPTRPKTATKKNPSSPGKSARESKGPDFRNMSEKDIEIEHLKSTILALDEKVKVIDSLRTDLDLER